MEWIEISVSTNSLGADLVSELLIRLGAKGTQIIDRADVPSPDKPSGYWELIDPAMIEAMPQDVIVKAWFADGNQVAGLQEHLLTLPVLSGFDLGQLSVLSGAVQDKDWSEYWKRFYKPFRAGKKLVVKPSWENYDPLEGDLVMELDPGMAFGTGTHETTSLCVKLIEKYGVGEHMLDVGTGSGILAIAAALLDAKRVTAVDIDPMAVEVARENVRKNKLESIIQVKEGDLTQGLDEVYDMAVANILAEVIMILTEPLKKHLRKNSLFLCSGIIVDKKDEVIQNLQQTGYEIIETVQDGDWVAIATRSL